MSMILKLLRLQIDNKTDLLKTYSPGKMVASIIKVLLFLIAITAGAVVILFRVFGLGIHVNAELISIVILTTQAISLCFATGNIITTLYMCKDNEMLVCLPVTPNQLFISKVLMIYIKEFAVNAIICIPLFVSLGFFGGYGANFYLSIIPLLLLLPILPIAVASFISIPIMAVIRFLKSRPTLSIIIILILVSACISVYVMIISSFAESFNIASKQLETVRKINSTILDIGGKIVIYISLANAMLSFKKWFYIAIFVLICALITGVTLLIIKPFYFKIAMSSLENSVKGTSKPKTFVARQPFISLIIREIKCIFRSPSDIFEYFLFTLLMPFIVLSYDKLLMTISVNQAGVNMIAGSHVMIVAIMAMLSNIISASAISRDGGNFYTSKIVPVSYYTQIFAKLTFNALFTVAALLLTMIFSFFTYPIWQVILSTVAIIFASVGHIALSIDMDIKSPSINMQGNEQASNASKSTPKSLIVGLIIGFVLGLIIIMSASSGSMLIPYLLIILLSIIFAVWRVWILILRINLAYDKIEM